jgi:hypothetical protein
MLCCLKSTIRSSVAMMLCHVGELTRFLEYEPHQLSLCFATTARDNWQQCSAPTCISTFLFSIRSPSLYAASTSSGTLYTNACLRASHGNKFPTDSVQQSRKVDLKLRTVLSSRPMRHCTVVRLIWLCETLGRPSRYFDGKQPSRKICAIPVEAIQENQGFRSRTTVTV